MTDNIQDLIASAQRGDTRALAKLCDNMYPRVERLVHDSMSHSVRGRRPWLSALFSTGDVVQEVFIRVLHDVQDIRGQSEPALLAYLATLTKNRIVDAIRFYEASMRDRRRVTMDVEHAEHPVVQPQHRPDEIAVTQERIVQFHEALSAFSERDRTLLRERIEHKTPFQELSDTLGYASADSARKAFHVAQAKLVMRLKKQ